MGAEMPGRPVHLVGQFTQGIHRAEGVTTISQIRKWRLRKAE